MLLGATVTVIVLIVVVIFVLRAAKNLFDLEINEFGDFVGGIAGALAFVWVIVAVFLQSRELEAQREELRLTRKELRDTRGVLEKQSAAADRQSAAAVHQTEILQEERKEREAGRLYAMLADLSDILAVQLDREAIKGAKITHNSRGQNVHIIEYSRIKEMDNPRKLSIATENINSFIAKSETEYNKVELIYYRPSTPLQDAAALESYIQFVDKVARDGGSEGEFKLAKSGVSDFLIACRNLRGQFPAG